MIHEKRTDVFIIGEGPTEEAVRTTFKQDARYRVFPDHAVLKAKKATDPRDGGPVYALASLALEDILRWYWARWFGFFLIDCSDYKKQPQWVNAEHFVAPPLSLPTVTFARPDTLSESDDKRLFDQARADSPRFFLIRGLPAGANPTHQEIAFAARDQVLPYAVKQYLHGAYGLFNWWEGFAPI